MDLKLLTVSTLLMCCMSFSQQLVPDSSFGTNGIVSVPTISYLGVNSIAVQPDGRIVTCAGNTQQNSHSVLLRRYLSNGDPDLSFGDSGVAVTPIVHYLGDLRNCMRLQADGKIVVCGTTEGNFTTYYDFAVARFNADGTIDNSFGVNGVVQNDFDNGTDVAYDVQLQPDNKIVVCGRNRSNIGLIRYNSNGSMDAGFGNNGKVVISFGTSNLSTSYFGHATCAKIQDDGKIILGGSSGNGTTNGSSFNHKFTLVRLLADGSPDNTFGTNGVAVTEFAGDPYIIAAIEAIVALPDNKIVAAGTLDIGDTDIKKIVLAKYYDSGFPDPAFGDNGVVVTQINTAQAHDEVFSLLQDTDGKFLAAGYTRNPMNEDFLLLQYNTDGSLDTSFNGSGYQTFDINTYDRYRSIALDPDGKILLGGLSAIDDENNVTAQLFRFTRNNLAMTTLRRLETIKVYPNPVTDYVNVVFPATDRQSLSIRLYAANGRELVNFESDAISVLSENSIRLHLREELSKGVYWLKINDKKNSTTVKILK